jgi:hypothetical protein
VPFQMYAFKIKYVFVYSIVYNKKRKEMIPCLSPRLLCRLPVNVISNYLLGIVREPLTVHTTDGTHLNVFMYRPAGIDLSKLGKIPCIVIVDTCSNIVGWEALMFRYATHGFAVLTYTGRRQRKLDDIFAKSAVNDLISFHSYIQSQFQWINPDAVFILGKSYASGIVLRCLASDTNKYIGGMVLSPIPYVSSIVSADDNTIPVASHTSAAMILSEMGVNSVASQQFARGSTPSDLRAQRLLLIDQDDRLTYTLDDIEAPLYVHVDIHDSLVNVYDSVQLFSKICKKQPLCCIRYAQGDHNVFDIQGYQTVDMYDDVLQWCRSILHSGSTQTYRTEVYSTSTQRTTFTSIDPAPDTDRGYKIVDSTKIILSTYIPSFLRLSSFDNIIQQLSYPYVPIRPLLYLQRDILWNRVFTRALDASGFPIVTLRIKTASPDSGFCLTLIEYDKRGYGKRLSYKYIMLKDTHVSSELITVRMSMISSRLQKDQELVLVVSNYDSRFTYTGRTEATVTFIDITLPYLYEY